MYIVGDEGKGTGKPAPAVTERSAGRNDGKLCMESVVSMLNNIVETACEHEPDLGLMRLVNLLDLYRVYLQLADHPDLTLHAHAAGKGSPCEAVVTQRLDLGTTSVVSFEYFVRDSHLLSIAALAASREAGEKVASPPPLIVSANDQESAR